MKKGILASNIMDFYAYIAFAFIIIIFFVLFKFSGERNVSGATSDYGYSDASLVLLMY